MLIKIRADYFKAALAAAAKNDERDYLNGFLLEPGKENGRMVTTDGYVMVIVPLELAAPWEDEEAVIYERVKNPPAKAEFCMVNTLSNRLSFIGRNGSPCTEEIKLSRIDAKFPDYERVRVIDKPRAAIKGIGFNIALVEPIRKALGAPRCRFEFTGVDSAISVSFASEPDVECILMPIRD